jgi:hypothetical protein
LDKPVEECIRISSNYQISTAGYHLITLAALRLLSDANIFRSSWVAVNPRHCWVKYDLGNAKASLSGTYQAFGFSKYAIAFISNPCLSDCL